MTLAQALKKLKAAGTAQNRKVYARHGVRPEMYGVSYANLGKLRKEIRTDHELARGLWESGNHDAAVLATMVADIERSSSTEASKSFLSASSTPPTRSALFSFSASHRAASLEAPRWERV